MTSPLTEPTQPPSPAANRDRVGWSRRLVRLVALGFAAIGGAPSCRHLGYARPAGHGPAGPAVPAERFEDEHGTWSDREVLLLGIGDSVTAGFGASPGMGYFDRVVSNSKNECLDSADECV